MKKRFAENFGQKKEQFLARISSKCSSKGGAGEGVDGKSLFTGNGEGKGAGYKKE